MALGVAGVKWRWVWEFSGKVQNDMGRKRNRIESGVSSNPMLAQGYWDADHFISTVVLIFNHHSLAPFLGICFSGTRAPDRRHLENYKTQMFLSLRKFHDLHNFTSYPTSFLLQPASVHHQPCTNSPCGDGSPGSRSWARHCWRPSIASWCFMMYVPQKGGAPVVGDLADFGWVLLDVGC